MSASTATVAAANYRSKGQTAAREAQANHFHRRTQPSKIARRRGRAQDGRAGKKGDAVVVLGPPRTILAATKEHHVLRIVEVLATVVVIDGPDAVVWSSFGTYVRYALGMGNAAV